MGWFVTNHDKSTFQHRDLDLQIPTQEAPPWRPRELRRLESRSVRGASDRPALFQDVEVTD